MKQLQLDLNKRLLIVEYDDCIIKKYGLKGYADKVLNSVEIENQLSELTGDDPSLRYNLICIGSELTLEIAEDLSELVKGCVMTYRMYDHRIITGNALESFISAIEEAGYHWGENPVKTMHFDGTRDEYWKAVNESESRTFNPEKTLIFEIV